MESITTTEERVELRSLGLSQDVQILNPQSNKTRGIKERIIGFPGLGLGLALMASVAFSFASLTIKLLPNVHPLSILFGRSVIQLVIFWPVCVFNNYKVWVPKDERLALFGRILFGSMAISGLYYSVRIMPLADASTIVFSSPAFTGILACIILKEPCGVFEVFTVVFVLLGVILISKPTFIFGGTTYGYQLEGTLAALNSAVTQAFVLVCLRKMRHTPSSVIIVTFSATVAIVCVIVLSFLDSTLVPLCGTDSLLYLACGLFSSVGQFLITTASKVEKAGPLSIARTTDILFAFVFQVTLLGVYPNWTSIVGAIIICLTVLILGFKNRYKEKSIIPSCCKSSQENT